VVRSSVINCSLYFSHDAFQFHMKKAPSKTSLGHNGPKILTKELLHNERLSYPVIANHSHDGIKTLTAVYTVN
jgi:hypothetical protein